MLAQLKTRLPEVTVGRTSRNWMVPWLWHRRDAPVQLLSRNRRDLAPWFPELGVHCRAPARDTLLEGEIVIANDAGQAGFAALQHWLTEPARAQSAFHEPRPKGCAISTPGLATRDAFNASGGGLGRRGVIVDVRFFAVLLLLVLAREVVTVHERVVVVRVGVPVGAVLPLVERVVRVMVRHVIVVMRVCHARVLMLWLVALTLSTLCNAAAWLRLHCGLLCLTPSNRLTVGPEKRDAECVPPQCLGRS